MTDDDAITPDSVTVHSLVGHAHVELAVICLASMMRFSDVDVSLHIHEDGTLTEPDRQRLTEALSPAAVSLSITRRSESDRQVEAILARHPAATAYRRSNVMGLKLFDTMLLGGPHAQGAVHCYCDCDVLFWRPYLGLWSLPDTIDALFMADLGDWYSMRSFQMLRVPGLRLARRVNAGLICCRDRFFDLDRIDWFLSRTRGLHAKAHLVEQTVWAMLALTPPADTRAALWNPAQIGLMHGGITPAKTPSVAGHFVGKDRWMLPRYVDRALRDPLSMARERLGTVTTGSCGPVRMAAFEATRVVGNAARRAGLLRKPTRHDAADPGASKTTPDKGSSSFADRAATS